MLPLSHVTAILRSEQFTTKIIYFIHIFRVNQPFWLQKSLHYSTSEKVRL